MCNIPDIPALSPLPTFEIPPEPPIVEPHPDEVPTFGIVPRRVDEDGREYYPHPLYAHSDEVPMHMRDYINSDDDEDEDMISFLGYNPHADEQMSNHEEDYETEEEVMEEDGDEQIPSEDEEQELPAKVDTPPPPQPIQPPRSSESLLHKSVEDRLWRRLREAELALKGRDNEIYFLHTKAEYAFRQAQQWEYVAKRIATDYRESFDRSWRSLKHLQLAPAHEQTSQAIDEVTSTLEKQYDLALAAEDKHFKLATDHV